MLKNQHALFLQHGKGRNVLKLKYTLEVVNMGDEYIAVPVGENAHDLQGVVKLNKAGCEILELLDHETTEEEIVANLAQKYNNTAENIKELVHTFIEQIKSFKLLNE